MDKIEQLEKEILENENVVIRIQGRFIIKKIKEGINEQKLDSWFNKLRKLYHESHYKENESVIIFLEEFKEKIKALDLLKNKTDYKLELEELKREKSYLIDEDTYYNCLKNDKAIEEINKKINEIEGEKRWKLSKEKI